MAAYTELTKHYHIKYRESIRDGESETGEAVSICTMPDLLAAMDVQAKVNESVLELVYSLLPEYNTNG